MKKLLILLITLSPLAFAQQAPASIARQLYSFSPMAQIYLKHLGLSDKNSNGVIDKDNGEGYEAFTAKYGNADVGFYANGNGVVYGKANKKLEETEIINYYYINIRFKPRFQEETAAIESEVKEYIYANNIPLVWLDDRQGTVMNAVNNILGEGWNEQKVTEDEADELFDQVMSGLNIYGRLTAFEDPYETGYYTLPELITEREGYCFEVAQFCFWFFSQLKINTIQVYSVLEKGVYHEVVRLCNSGKIIDYFGSSYQYKNVKWEARNSLYAISDYYYTLARKNEPSANDRILWENTVIFYKYDFLNVCTLMRHYFNSVNPAYQEIIALGEFVVKNMNINQIMKLSINSSDVDKYNIKLILIMLAGSYSAIRDRKGFDNTVRLLNQYFRKDQEAQGYIDYFSFSDGER